MSKDNTNGPNNPDTIQVYCRIRPVDESKANYTIDTSFEQSIIHFRKPRSIEAGPVNNSIESYNFPFTGVFDQNVDQDEVFERCAKKCVMSALDGYNSTIFAYGQSGSGKTYTMTGGDGTYEKRGIIPRAISLLYEEAEKSRDREFSFSVAYMEIYKGYGYDLLSDKRDVMHIKDLPKVIPRIDASGNVVFQNIISFPVKTEEDALDKLFIGDKNRVLSETMLNDASTRSHCIFTIHVESKEPGSSIVKSSKLHLVDLAGSERVHKTNSSGETLEEAKSINLSLYHLERFILSISENQEHIPYRESLITIVLKDSIGGNCKTIMIATVNPSDRHLGESISTCKFAMRVASIRQHATINEKLDPYVQIKKLKKRIEELEEEVQYLRGSDGKRDSLDGNEKAIVKERVEDYINDPDQESTLNLGGDHLRVREAFSLLKSMILDLGKKSVSNHHHSMKLSSPNGMHPKMLQQQQPQQPSKGMNVMDGKKQTSIINTNTTSSQPLLPLPLPPPPSSIPDDFQEKLKNLTVAIELRDIEIDILVSMLNKKQRNLSEVSIQTDTWNVSSQQSSPKTWNRNHPLSYPSTSFHSIQSLENNIHKMNHSLENHIPKTNHSLENNHTIPKTNHSFENNIQKTNNMNTNSIERKPLAEIVTKEVIRERLKEKEKSILSQTGDTAPKISNEKIAILADATGMRKRAEAFEIFRQKYRNYNVIEKNKNILGEKIALAKDIAKEINDKKNAIDSLKNRLIQLRTERAAQNLVNHSSTDEENDELFPEEIELKKLILRERDGHQSKFNELKELKKEIEHLKRVLEMSRVRLEQDFENWYKTTHPVYEMVDSEMCPSLAGNYPTTIHPQGIGIGSSSLSGMSGSGGSSGASVVGTSGGGGGGINSNTLRLSSSSSSSGSSNMSLSKSVMNSTLNNSAVGTYGSEYSSSSSGSGSTTGMGQQLPTFPISPIHSNVPSPFHRNSTTTTTTSSSTTTTTLTGYEDASPRILKQAWTEHSSSNSSSSLLKKKNESNAKTTTTLNEEFMNTNFNHPTNHHSRSNNGMTTLSEDNPYFKKLREHVAEQTSHEASSSSSSSTSGSLHNSSNLPKRMSLLQKAYKI